MERSASTPPPTGSPAASSARPAPPPLGGSFGAWAEPTAIPIATDNGKRRGQSWLRRKLGAAGAALLALLAKLKAVLLLLPKIKLLATAGTMAVSVVAYAAIWGFPFAAGFVVLILVHEMGHVIALRREGIRASAPMFIPFMGAVISARSLGNNALAEARVGLAGPLLGSVGAAACILIWHATGNDMWRALAYTGFLLNLFNLLPVVPLDGGRAMAAMAPWMWFVGFAGLLALMFFAPNPILLIILIFGGYSTYRRWQARRHGGAEQQAYYRVAPLDRLLVAAVYIALIALLVVGMHATTLSRTIP
ncbi:MAG TPA: site-2 protease family protein [Solirubrobacteraceae bacterium]|nr:site-2 protease family protein [Solirubrobacteraceae bacterium]